ncbi:hypothetical protein PWR63_25290 [Paraburkholderia sp. A2WS-5]
MYARQALIHQQIRPDNSGYLNPNQIQDDLDDGAFPGNPRGTIF